MKLYHQLIERVNEKFANALVPGTGKRAPRPGYYFIRDSFFDKVEPLGEILMAHVNWKANLTDYFIEDAIFKIALTNLFSAKPKETANLEKEDLIGKVIFVFDPVFDIRFFNGEPKKVLKCQWHFIDQLAKFITAENAAIHVYFDGSITSNNAYQNLIENSSYDVLEAIAMEANYGHYDGIIEDSAYADDYVEDVEIDTVYDEPVDNHSSEEHETGII